MLLRRIGVACVMAAGLVGFAAPTLASDRALPMRFEFKQEAPAEICGAQCRLWISAAGAITAETPTEFRNFVSGRDLTGATVVLDSDGGSVLGAMALGRQIRSLKLATTVGRIVDVAAAGSRPASTMLVPKADCESMCAFVLLAGVHRSVPDQARVMVLQIWLGDRREDPTAANYSAEDLVLVQRDIGRLVQYTADMGGPADLLGLALRIPPWEPMHALTRDELRLTLLDMDSHPAPAAVAQAPATSVNFTPVAAGNRADVSHEQGWSMVDRAGANVLARRHPLTVEGDEIGSFDLFFACGSDEGYLATYVEERRAEDRSQLAPLSSVTLRAGGQTAALKIVSSDLRGGGTGTLASVASGTVPAALVRAFAASGSHSMLVDTDSANLRTTIRIGNAGAARNLPQLASRCQAAGTRAELTAPRTGGLAQR
jgi:hypothetical protein